MTLKPEDLDLEATIADFKRWRKQFEDFYAANQMDKLEPREQCAHLRSCMTTKVQYTLKHLLEIEDDADVGTVIEALNRHFSEALNVMTRRLHFQQCVPKAGEKFSDFLIRLRLLGDNAELDNMSYQDRLASHIVATIAVLDANLQKDLLKMTDHDFKSVKEKCLAWESSDRNQVSMATKVSANKISTYKQNKNRARSEHKPAQTSPGQSSSDKKFCFRCGALFMSGHMSQCPAKKTKCSGCGLIGHYEKVCKRKQNSSNSVKTNAIFLRVASSQKNVSTPMALIHIANGYGEIDINALPDTGATESIIGADFVRKHGFNIDESIKRDMFAANASPLRCYGIVKLNVRFYDRRQDIIFYVTPDFDGIILSWHALLAFGCIQSRFPEPIDGDGTGIIDVATVQQADDLITDDDVCDYKNSVISHHAGVFDATVFKAMSGKPMHIYLNDIDDDKKPKPCLVSRPIPYAFRDAAKAELDDMVRKGSTADELLINKRVFGEGKLII
jgi:hypothetical protein